jgi:excisionase family DNA binding protein
MNNYKPTLLTKHQIAKETGVSWRTVNRWIVDGCPCINVGGMSLSGKRWRFRLDDVVAWLETRQKVSAR